jgi:hypothetical protein
MVPPGAGNGVTFVSPWINAVSTTINPPGGKDLLVTFSAQTALADLSHQGGTSTPSSGTFTQENNIINARILVDGKVIAPVVTYDCLIRSLAAVLANPITACHEVDPSGVVTCAFGGDFLGQLIDTTGVRSFTFAAPDVGPGTHTVTAQVQFVAFNFRSPNAGFNASSIAAVVGARTLTVQQVKLDPQ